MYNIETVGFKSKEERDEYKEELKNLGNFIKSRGIKNEIILVNDSTIILVNIEGHKQVLNTVYNLVVKGE